MKAMICFKSDYCGNVNWQKNKQKKKKKTHTHTHLFNLSAPDFIIVKFDGFHENCLGFSLYWKKTKKNNNNKQTNGDSALYW